MFLAGCVVWNVVMIGDVTSYSEIANMQDNAPSILTLDMGLCRDFSKDLLDFADYLGPCRHQYHRLRQRTSLTDLGHPPSTQLPFSWECVCRCMDQAQAASMQ